MQLIASRWIAQSNVTLCFSLLSLFLLTLSYSHRKKRQSTTTTKTKHRSFRLSFATFQNTLDVILYCREHLCHWIIPSLCGLSVLDQIGWTFVILYLRMSEQWLHSNLRLLEQSTITFRTCLRRYHRGDALQSVHQPDSYLFLLRQSDSLVQ